MARQVDVQYVRSYTDGTAARKLEVPQPRKTARSSAAPGKKKRIIVHIDPLAILGIVMAVVMLALMALGVSKFLQARQELAVMESYVQTLQQCNAQLQQQYEAGYDLENVKQTALALGMVPMDQVRQITIHVPQPQQEVRLSGWDQFFTFLSSLFA